MAQYLLNIVQPVGEIPPPEFLEPVMRDLAALTEEMRAAGVWVFAAALHQPAASTVVRAEGGDVLITDGPYAEAKEFVGGFDVIEAADLDQALVWAGKLTRVLGGLPVEVRPVARTV
ncbi:YciI family protein [Blastococcus xanthinilyticus]|uniref:YCII-related domain-containing protein n=1 Tax=Blastococcus xanthinilyticus TaxID=1564164 RepID=A0A5S5CNK2_9ACTN|nr:YciI family protein [Blastococcus xanthinilyticus]TYP84622.1 hypothetical protein BD833_11451 [Blastococcus xanthinilyticus]